MTRKIICIVDDMFFASKIRATAEALAVEISFPRTKEAALQKTRDLKPDLILVDLHNQRFNPFEFITELRTEPDLELIPTLGFFSHVQVELQRNAIAAGIDQVIPRSIFARDLSQILGG
ncbi:MAG: hypothetical protein DMF69_06315 [Acidobacteria bacterium]|nr:MAG: hypothetical protein DMF69_06315 [Acidobacteriota bacterium]